jgi:hypothetical protein
MLKEVYRYMKCIIEKVKNGIFGRDKKKGSLIIMDKREKLILVKVISSIENI